jgi:large subunit ribosomal protein L32
MAVPKKRTSKSKKNIRKAAWKRKAGVAAQKAISLGKSILTGQNKGFVYPLAEEDGEEDEE